MSTRMLERDYYSSDFTSKFYPRFDNIELFEHI
jgi:hypothetical protein